MPLAKAARMTNSRGGVPLQRKEAVAQGVGGKPTNVSYICKKKKYGYGRNSMRRQDRMPARNKKNFRPTKSGAGMTRAGVKAYRRMNPGSKLKTAVTGKVKKGSAAAKRRKSYCARSARSNEKISKNCERS